MSDLGLQLQAQHLSTVNRHLRLLVDQISEGALIVESLPLSGRGPQIVFVNRGLCRMTGQHPEEVIGHPLARVFDGERLAEFLALLPRVAQACRAAVTRAHLIGSKGSERVARWMVSPVRGPDESLLHFILTVSEEPPAPPSPPAPRADESGDPERLYQTDRLENLEVIASGIAHDFRNQLTSVMLNISNAAAQLPGSDLQKQFLERASGSSRQAKELADQLMEFARGGTPVTGLAHVGQLLRECASLTLSGSSSRCHIGVDDDLWLARVDKTRIKQVLNNLLINASQAMPEGGHIQASAKNVTLAERQDPELPPGPYVLINVHDRGTGIPEHILPHIFKRNFTTKKTGNGLGLASSYHIVRGHEGTIRVRTTPNVGTEFSVFLPACPDGQVELEPPPPVTVDSPLSPGCGSILVVDDQHVVRAAVKASVEALGYEADEASTGEEAIDRYRRRFHEGRPFHLVLMDRTLPGGHNGDDAMREIRHLDPFARVIASSGAIDVDGDIDLRQLGYVSILPKPFDIQKLSHTLSAAASAQLPA